MLIASFVKQPGEVLRRTIDFACRLDNNQTIASLVTTVEHNDPDVVEAVSMTVDAYLFPVEQVAQPQIYQVDGEAEEVVRAHTQIEYFVNGGLDEELYKITFSATISDGQVQEEEVECFVEEY